jgi:RHS repeat-associated protein
LQENAYYPFGFLINDFTYNPGMVAENRYRFTGHESINNFSLPWYDCGSRYYNPLTGIFMGVDPQAHRGYRFHTYAYCANNPVVFVDPDGEFWHIVIGAVVGGVVNLAVKAINGQISSFWDGVKAFGVGAAAGAVGAATGGTAFLAAGGGAAGAGGFLAGAAGGAAGYAFSAPIQNLGNHAFFGDPLMTLEQFAQGICFAALTGGAMHGVIALANGRNFMTGKLPTPTPQPQSVLPPIKKQPTELKTDAMKPEVQPLKESPSPRVQKVLDAIDEVKADGGIVKPNTLKPNQELNITIEHQGVKTNIRIETHILPPKYGGDYITPMRHLNSPLNGGHLLLPPL